MIPLLHNPVYKALRSGDSRFNQGTTSTPFYDEAVAPFAGFNEANEQGFAELHQLLPAGKRIVYARPEPITPPDGWQLFQHIAGVQMVLEKEIHFEIQTPPVALNEEHVPQMMALATLTKPGPFRQRTIELGHYYGFFEGDQLIAMTGQRMHVHQYAEISAVCTHPDHLGKGLATTLVQHQAQLIKTQGAIPFLHVRDDNTRAIDVYKRLGFVVSRAMHFYFLERR